MKPILKEIIAKARSAPKVIVFPEGDEPRIFEAACIIARKGIAHPILLGDVAKIKRLIAKTNISCSKFQIINPLNSTKLEEYAKILYQIRKSKGMTTKQALKTASEVTYFGTLMVHAGDADGLVSGAVHTTGETIRPALQIIRTHEEYRKVSGLFMMMLEDNKVYLFADCAVVIEPTAHELAHIAVDSARTAIKFGLKPKVAMLSFSTNGSAKHPYVDKVRQAVRYFKRMEPDIPVEGDIQVDAALNPIVRKIKNPDSKLKGTANVLIFPDLQSGNISYKLVERLAKAKAVGPIIQGLKKPVNDLSRGCSVEDIVNVTALTVVEAGR